MEPVSVRAADLADAGLGLQYGTVRLVRTPATWLRLGIGLVDDLASKLPACVVAVEHVGSTAVPELLAKPVIDLAIGVVAGTEVGELIEPMEHAGWIYRGDAGREGGWVFVFEDVPRHRVAHAHGVKHDGVEWRRYLAFRALLRGSAESRLAYEATKLELAKEYEHDARSYTSGKTDTVWSLLPE